MCMACSLFESVKAKLITEKRKRVVRTDQLTSVEERRFRGLLSNAGCRFETGSNYGKRAVLVWVLDWK